MRRLLARLGVAVATVAGAAALVWALQLLAPGDPARRVLAATGIHDPLPAQVEAAQRELGLDQPVYRRLMDWYAGVARGDLGVSWRTGRPVRAELADRLPATGRLVAATGVLAALAAIPVTLLASASRRRWPDGLLRVGTFVAAATPSFLVGTLLLDILVVRAGVGRVLSDGSWRAAWLPAVPLALGIAAYWSRVLRTALGEAATAPFLETAAARGSGRLRLLFVHALPNAARPLLAAVGVAMGSLLAGAVVIETLFTWPGVGRHLIEAIEARDAPVVQGFVLFGVACYVATSLLTDMLAWLIDPRPEAA
ncbi:ABC transporter permease [Allorhizocola rhizosphaerae]|uniref:ABC transporter permease n=1 Tax=Allorhizocola rhizosphaerae TaxID=1872709 RepID=UPI001B8B2164|nr:ABC transporter permease [Allorhizocola rhizosphaerae]